MEIYYKAKNFTTCIFLLSMVISQNEEYIQNNP